MATLTPAIARELIHRSILGGIPHSEFDKYGGYDVVDAMYRSQGGTYNLAKELTSQAELDRLTNLNTSIDDTGGGKTFVLGASTPKYTGSFDETEFRKTLEKASKSGGYSGTNLDSWVERAKVFGPQEALVEFRKVNPGVGASVTNISRDLGQLAADKILSNIPAMPITNRASIIPELNRESLYAQAPSSYPTSPTFASPTPQLLAAPSVGLPALIEQTSGRPQLSTPVQYLNPATGTFDISAAPASEVVTLAEGGNVESSLEFTPAELGSTFDVSQYINPETGRFYVNEAQRNVLFNPLLQQAEARERGLMEADPDYARQSAQRANTQKIRDLLAYRYRIRPDQPYRLAEGGLASVAQQVASEGRRGDSTLVHMTNDEVEGLQSLANLMGGSLTINPETGLPEANFFRKILPFVAAFAAPYLAPLVGGSALGGAALAGGLAGAGTVLGGGSLDQGIKTGLTAFGSAALTSGAMGSNPLGVGGESTFNIANTFGASQAGSAGAMGAESGGVDVTGGVTADELLASSTSGGRSGELVTNPAALQPAAATGTAAAKTAAGGTKILGMDPSTLALLGIAGYGGSEASKEQGMYEQQQREMAEEQRRRRQAGYDAFARSGLASIPMGAGGGMVAMAGGGMTYMEAGGTTGPTGLPRDVTGTGDGMSDSVPATIEGVQEARLADGEFVIPADVVADIGNGSSDAGSKKLYDMMDRIRNARHGTTEQPPEINAEALMPA